MRIAKRNEELVHRLYWLLFEDSGAIWLIKWKPEIRETSRIDRIGSNGYSHVWLKGPEGERIFAYAHRLVWFHFHGPIPDGMTPNHENGVKSDNRLSNLNLMTYAEQMRHSVDVLGNLHGQRGAANHEATLTTRRVDAIRRRAAAGEPRVSIARRFDIDPSTVSKVALGRRWASS